MAATLTGFLKENTKQKEHRKVVVSERFIDPQTEAPYQWEMRPLGAKEDEILRNECTRKKREKNGKVTEEFNKDTYIAKAVARCVVFPDLHDAELQDNWGVKGEVDLLQAMLLSGEYLKVLSCFNELNGFSQSLDDMVDEAKN